MNSQAINNYYSKELSELENGFYQYLTETLGVKKKNNNIPTNEYNLMMIFKMQMWEYPNAFALLYLFRMLGEDNSGINQNVINLYLRFLTYPSPRLDFYFKIFNQIRAGKGEREISIEDEVYRAVGVALGNGVWERELQLSPNGADDKKKEREEQYRELLNYRLNLIAEWFLYRYQLFSAFQTFRLAGKKSSEIKDLLPSRKGPFAYLILTFILSVVLVFRGLSVAGFDGMHALIILSMSVLLLWVVPKCFVPWRHSVFRLLLPRQLGAIVGGYFLMIVVGSEFWDFFVRILYVVGDVSPWLLLFIPLVLMLLVAVYLFWEIRNHLGFFDKQKGGGLVFTVLIMGLLETTVVGGLFFNLTGNYLQSLFSDYKIFFYASPLGYEQLAFVGTFMVLALFVGIFLQIFWQDEPITVSL